MSVLFASFRERLNRLIGGVSWWFAVSAGILFICMIFVTSYGVVMRYFFRRPEPYSYEINTILLLWTFVLALPLVELLDEHIRADIFIQYAPKALREFLWKIVSPVLGILYSSVLTWKGLDNAVHSLRAAEKSMSILGEPLFPVKVLIPLCYGLVTVVILRKLILNLSRKKSEEGSTD
jgi:TRAP-type C4-dicarboxylate transport system permease small subunit